MFDAIQLEPATAALLAAICFVAGAIRGFAGFALSAFVMACAAPILSPLALVPMLWWLEMSASLLQMKGGWADADRAIAFGITVGSALGLPVGLWLTLSLPLEASRVLALSLLIALAALQLMKLRLRAFASDGGAYAAGFGAGVITGVAGAGGMFVALYVLARELPARMMRGSLNIYLLGAGLFGIMTHILMGTMDRTAALRGAVFMLPSLAGVFAGRALFTPRWEPYYKPFCLTLLIGLAAAGLLRLGLEG